MLRQFFRSPFLLLVGGSFVLFLISIAAWMASYAWPVVPSRGCRLNTHVLSSSNGRISYSDVTNDLDIDQMDKSPFSFASTTIRPGPETRVVLKLDVANVTRGTLSQSSSSQPTISVTAGGVIETSYAVATPNQTSLLIEHPFPGVVVRAHYTFPSPRTSGGSFLVKSTRDWTATDVDYWLIVLATGTLPALAFVTSARRWRDDRWAARQGITGPVFRVRPGIRRRSGFRRVLDIILLTATTLSLCLFVACICAWMYSHRPGGRTWNIGPHPEDSWSWSLQQGVFTGSRNKMRSVIGPETYHDAYIFHLTCGLSTYTGPNYYSWNFRVPLWLPTVLTSLPLAWWLIRRPNAVRRKRLVKGLCPICTYDLTMTHTRCPECGTKLIGG